MAKAAMRRRQLLAGSVWLALAACSDRSREPADGQDWQSADDARLYLEDGSIWLDLHVESLLPESTHRQEQLLKSGFSAKFVYEILLFARIEDQWQSTLARRYDLTLTWNHWESRFDLQIQEDGGELRAEFASTLKEAVSRCTHVKMDLLPIEQLGGLRERQCFVQVLAQRNPLESAMVSDRRFQSQEERSVIPVFHRWIRLFLTGRPAAQRSVELASPALRVFDHDTK